MPAIKTIKSRTLYQEVYQRGIKIKQPFFFGYFLSNGQESNRYGFVASRKIGGAVQRNRARRLLREVCRRLPWTGNGWDIVLVARSAISGASCNAAAGQWQQALESLRKSARLAD